MHFLEKSDVLYFRMSHLHLLLAFSKEVFSRVICLVELLARGASFSVVSVVVRE